MLLTRLSALPKIRIRRLIKEGCLGQTGEALPAKASQANEIVQDMLLLSHIENMLVPFNLQFDAFNAYGLRLAPNLRV
jgi:hypothetical protein